MNLGYCYIRRLSRLGGITTETEKEQLVRQEEK